MTKSTQVWTISMLTWLQIIVHMVETCGLSLWGCFFVLLLWSLVKYTDIKPHHAYILTYSFNTPQQHNFPRLCLLLYTFCLPFYHRWWKFPYLKPFLFQQSTSRQCSSPVPRELLSLFTHSCLFYSCNFFFFLKRCSRKGRTLSSKQTVSRSLKH